MRSECQVRGRAGSGRAGGRRRRRACGWAATSARAGARARAVLFARWRIRARRTSLVIEVLYVLPLSQSRVPVVLDGVIGPAGEVPGQPRGWGWGGLGLAPVPRGARALAGTEGRSSGVSGGSGRRGEGGELTWRCRPTCCQTLCAAPGAGGPPRLTTRPCGYRDPGGCATARGTACLSDLANSAPRLSTRACRAQRQGGAPVRGARQGLRR